jgi:antitoxin VapB
MGKIPLDIVYTLVYTSIVRWINMQTTKVFKSGNSQAVRIPQEYQVTEEELMINKIGNTIVLFPKNDPWELFKKSLTEFGDDYFKDGRNQPKIQKRRS